MKIKQTDLSYVSGIIDAEGCICISRRSNKTGDTINYKAELTTSMCDIHSIKFIQSLFGGNIRIGNGKRRDGRIRHNCYIISYSGSKMKRILELTLPYIKVKQEQAKLAIKFIELKEKPTKKRKLFQTTDKKTLKLLKQYYIEVKRLKTSNWIKK